MQQAPESNNGTAWISRFLGALWVDNPEVERTKVLHADLSNEWVQIQQFGQIAIGLLTIYVFWDVSKAQPGNRLVRSGILTPCLALTMGPVLVVKSSVPIEYIGLLLFCMCMLTMFFLLQRACLALRNRGNTQSGHRKSTSD